MTTTEHTCPRCGTTALMTRYAVCVPCTAALGWEPACVACLADQRGEDTAGLVHVATCGGTMKTYPSEEAA